MKYFTLQLLTLGLTILCHPASRCCASPNVSVTIETSAGRTSEPTAVYMGGFLPINAYFYSSSISGADTSIISASVDHTTITVIARPTVEGVRHTQLTFYVSYTIGARDYTTSTETLDITIITHPALTPFITHASVDTLRPYYLGDSSAFMVNFNLGIDNFSTTSLLVDRWALNLRSGKQVIPIAYNSIGTALPFISLAIDSISVATIRVTIPEQDFDSLVNQVATLSGHLHFGGKDSTMQFPILLLIDSPNVKRASITPSVPSGQWQGIREAQSVTVNFDGALRQVSFDSLGWPFHATVISQSEHQIQLTLWQSPSTKGIYVRTLKVHYTVNAPILSSYTDSVATVIYSTVFDTTGGAQWEIAPFQPPSHSDKLYTGDDGNVYLYGEEAYRLRASGDMSDKLIDRKQNVVDLRSEGAGILTSVVKGDAKSIDPALGNEILQSMDSGKHWQTMARGPIVIQPGLPVDWPATFAGFSPVTALRINDSVYYALCSELLYNNFDKWQFPFVSSDHCQTWRVLSQLGDSNSIDHNGLVGRLESDSYGHVLISNQVAFDTVNLLPHPLHDRGFFFFRRTPNGALIFTNYHDSCELDRGRIGKLRFASPFFFFRQSSGPIDIAILDDSDFVILGDGLQRTIDGGKHWLSYSEGLYHPTSIALASDGTLYAMTDSGLYRSQHKLPARYVLPTASVAMESLNVKSSIPIFPNPASNVISIRTTEQKAGITITDYLGRTYQLPVHSVNGYEQIDVSSLREGVYFVSQHTANGILSAKLEIAR